MEKIVKFLCDHKIEIFFAFLFALIVEITFKPFRNWLSKTAKYWLNLKKEWKRKRALSARARSELTKHLNSDLYIERNKSYSLIDELISYGNEINCNTGNKLFDIFKREKNLDEQIRIINLLQRGRFFSIRNDVSKYWIAKRTTVPDTLSGQISNYFSSDIECLANLLSLLENIDISDSSYDKIIFDIFVAIRAQINANKKIESGHFKQIKSLIETKWHQKAPECPIIDEVYKQVTGNYLQKS